MRNKFGRIAVYITALVAAQSSPPDARDMFYSAADMVGATNPTEKPPVKPPPAVHHRPVPKDPEAHFQTVSQPAELALGLRYSILKKTNSGLAEMKSGTVFHSGDKIRISVMSNQKGYLYVI